MWLVICVGLLVWALIPVSSRAAVARLDASPRAPRNQNWARPAAVVPIAGLLVFALTGQLAWALTAVFALAAGVALWLRRRRRQAAKHRETEVAHAAKLLSTLMRSGQIPLTALEAASTDFEVLRPASAVAKLGGDVADTLRAQANDVGGEGLATIASAWQVSERSGAPIAGVLARVADTLREERRVREVIDTELASARASGQMMAVLPFGAVGLGAFAGINSIEFLLTSPLGPWLLCVAVALTGAGVLWIDRLAAP